LAAQVPGSVQLYDGQRQVTMVSVLGEHKSITIDCDHPGR